MVLQLHAAEKDSFLRKLENAYFARKIGCNKENVYYFFDLLVEKIVDEFQLATSSVYNVDA